ncbi:lipoyl synthase [Pyrobaculum calidifontis]|uniref:Lipoyl synthase n=1 Tax=Pyrobaculum calidifontis (strain DSM 21063 / JCM 11548 / VA1) TaxID=410359 RepID=LIPA_PYRCJ|nr:lipoyl synthase [Pyrobaculum calidifontis]A3MW09.1 RecName: Full=Lipoyl synthase; AltName: Full=Lip-syn; Short=LS; AltName: Full=Lipoate synthase; AltName: Full=Lipoic acid synthase; AltName: Full=Sulfur insertion protein LipA [Pyrobaculum calidifontis JCM 11548]ABO08826.1 lipoic acid synthetase [Pyrobaculum calidifontis JCM 11548]
MELPSWIRVKAGDYGRIVAVREAVFAAGVHTICEEAHCPNIFSCWGEGTATFLILGDVCTRACKFCAVKTGDPRGFVDPTEPARVAEAVAKLGLRYVVITSVDRDDLPDGGASQFASVVKAVKARAPWAKVEVLTPDFGGSAEAVASVVEAGPDVYAHNLETVRRLTPLVRDRRASYDVSLRVLKMAKELGAVTKSGLMVGLGETFDEVLEALSDLRRVDVDIVTIGQYLKPRGHKRFLEVQRWVPPEEFEKYREAAEAMGFKAVVAGPLVRSSYKAHEAYLEMLRKTIGR